MSRWKDRPVLVTGATGFLGGWLTRGLIARGASVVALVRDRVPSNIPDDAAAATRLSLVYGAVEDLPTLERALGEYEVDTVFHLAAQAIVGVANRNPVSTFETNVRGTWNLLEACRRSPLVRRVVVASSDKAYGSHEKLPYGEDFPLQGRHPYDVSKSCADLIAHAYHATYGTPVCITRCGNLFGPGDLNWSRIVPGTIRSVLAGEEPLIRSDGSPRRDYVHVKDIADAYVLLAEKMEDDKSVPGRAYNFGTGTPLSVLEITEALLQAAGRSDLRPRILNEAKAEIPHQYLSSERARRELGWSPGAPLEKRLAETVSWYEAFLGRPS